MLIGQNRIPVSGPFSVAQGAQFSEVYHHRHTNWLHRRRFGGHLQMHFFPQKCISLEEERVRSEFIPWVPTGANRKLWPKSLFLLKIKLEWLSVSHPQKEVQFSLHLTTVLFVSDGIFDARLSLKVTSGYSILSISIHFVQQPHTNYCFCQIAEQDIFVGFTSLQLQWSYGKESSLTMNECEWKRAVEKGDLLTIAFAGRCVEVIGFATFQQSSATRSLLPEKSSRTTHNWFPLLLKFCQSGLGYKFCDNELVFSLFIMSCQLKAEKVCVAILFLMLVTFDDEWKQIHFVWEFDFNEYIWGRKALWSAAA